jgi:hypothetical protein
MEFGVRWGQNLALFSNLRGMYERVRHVHRIPFSGRRGQRARGSRRLLRYRGLAG